ncbi:hypothetical protein JRO89_XS10G0055900 [Xanthoceras sorbifolium]|uniref:Uncharacterized protein n=1 Tax=Xanthoceras sorbifolium TaxID=99658 RepID=A0ABQ8HHY6_9ROSI|nr:hypothetical protein JRO89_XS10G0055900 [Xanthoceras sorbifolium]
MKLQKVSEPGTQEPVVVKQIDQMNIRGQNAGSPQFSFSLAEPLAKTHSNWVSTSRNLTILVVKLNSGDDGEVSFAVLKRKLGFCSSKLIAWSQGKFGSLRKQIAAKQEFISSLLGGNLDEDEQRQVKDLECSLSNLLALEELYWRQRARVNWLGAGDRNSKFFHLKASARKKKNTIKMLFDDNGVCHSDSAGIHKTVCKYFNSIFSSSKPSISDLEDASRFIDHRVDTDMLGHSHIVVRH